MRETVEQKARRLVAAGRVHRVPAETFAVVGDHGTYQVTYWTTVAALDDRSRWYCTCPAEGRCAHIEAARQLST